MNKTIPEALDFLHFFLPSIADVRDADIVIAPPFTSLFSIAERFVGTNVKLSAQNVFYEEKGAFTGEVSPIMLKDAGCDFVIIGHSERRQYFHETDEVVNKKIKLSRKHDLGVIHCVGETLSERVTGKTFAVLTTQVMNGLRDVSPQDLVMAYEPVWAIGTGENATSEQAQVAHGFIRNELRKLYGDSADSVRILYGGSVTPENVSSLSACPDVDGVLVGGASLKPDSFEKIIKFARGNR